MIIGIDPGITGAIAVVDNDGQVVLHDLATCPKDRGKGLMIHAGLLADLLRAYRCDHKDSLGDVVVLESVTSSPQMGVTSAFSFGRSLGVIEGVVAGLGYPLVLVQPSAWKKAFGLIGRDKDEARNVATRLAPQVGELLKRKKDIGRAEALLIALWYGGSD
jgi:hypothetical protein